MSMYTNNYNLLGFQGTNSSLLNQLNEESTNDTYPDGVSGSKTNNINDRSEQIQNNARPNANRLQHNGHQSSMTPSQIQQLMKNYQFQLQMQALQGPQAIGHLKSPTMNGFQGNGQRKRYNNNSYANVNGNGFLGPNNNSNPMNFARNSLFNNIQPPVVNQQVAYNQLHQQSIDSVPQTPFDLNYGTSMLPRNLLMSSPFIGSTFNSPMTATMSPGAVGSKYMTVTGPAPPIIGAPPKSKRKGMKSLGVQPSRQPESDDEDSSSEDDVIITEGGHIEKQNGHLEREHNEKSDDEDKKKRSNSIKKEKYRSASQSSSSLTKPELEGIPVTIEETKSPLSKKVILLRHINSNVKIYEFLNYLKFGPLQFCYLINDEETSENQIKLKFIYEKTHNNFINHLHLYINEFYQEFKSPNATYKIVDYNKKDDYMNATALKHIIQDESLNSHNEDYVDLEYEIEQNKATRCLKISKFTKFELLNDDHENLEKKLRLGFGEVDLINTNEDRNIMTIHFLNLVSSIKLYKQLDNINKEKVQKDPTFVKHLGHMKYTQDRCCQIDDNEFEQTFGQTSEFDEHLENESERIAQDIILPASSQFAQPHLGMFHQDPLNGNFQDMSISGDIIPPIIQNINSLNVNENRTVYLGNLASKTTVEEVCNVVRGGILQSIKLIAEKHICFITFISAASATLFFASSNMNGLTIHNKKIKVGWGKNPGDLPNSIALAVTVGASRNVYIGVKDDEDEGSGPKVVPDEPTLRKDFSRWGEIEQINFFKDGYCAFVNFINITSAMKAIDEFHGPDQQKIHESFNNKYTHYKINFAKDRCGNPPKFVSSKPKKKKKNKNNNGNVLEKKSPNQVSSFDGPTASAQPSGDISQITDEQALALASIGITTQLIDEKIKKHETENENPAETTVSEDNKHKQKSQQQQQRRSTTPSNQTPRRLSVSNYSPSPARSASPASISSSNLGNNGMASSNNPYNYYAQPQQFTPMQQNAKLYGNPMMVDPYNSPSNFMQQNLLVSKAQPRRTDYRHGRNNQSFSNGAVGSGPSSKRSSLHGGAPGGAPSGANAGATALMGGLMSSGSQVMAQYLAKAQFDSLLFAPNGSNKSDEGLKKKSNKRSSVNKKQ